MSCKAPRRRGLQPSPRAFREQGSAVLGGIWGPEWKQGPVPGRGPMSARSVALLGPRLPHLRSALMGDVAAEVEMRPTLLVSTASEELCEARVGWQNASAPSSRPGCSAQRREQVGTDAGGGERGSRSALWGWRGPGTAPASGLSLLGRLAGGCGGALELEGGRRALAGAGRSAVCTLEEPPRPQGARWPQPPAACTSGVACPPRLTCWKRGSRPGHWGAAAGE